MMTSSLPRAAGIAALITVSIACSKVTRGGVVVMRIDDHEAHVGLGSNDVTRGDQLTLFRHVCTGAKIKTCHKQAVGSGTVTEVLNESYSIARFSTVNSLREGDIVEKTSRPQ
jgi:hypothetical protein